MPFSVNACFEAFRREKVDLDPGQIETARASRDFVWRNLEILSGDQMLPRIYSGMSLNFGSFERKTKIRELDDIDMMVCFSGIGGLYSTLTENKEYRITFEESVPVIKDCLGDNGELNSRKMVNQLIKGLEEVEHYKKAEMHRDHEAARLQLVSYPWNFDIVPCFYTVEGFYLIPDGQGRWKNTDPRIDKTHVTEVNLKNHGIVLPLIRLMKYWKKKKWNEVVSSYMFEQMVLNATETIHLFPIGSWQSRVQQVLQYLSNAIKQPVWDSKGIQGDLNDLDQEAREDLSLRAFMSYLSATKAIESEMAGAIQEAVKQWALIFGDEFPAYGA